MLIKVTVEVREDESRSDSRYVISDSPERVLARIKRYCDIMSRATGYHYFGYITY